VKASNAWAHKWFGNAIDEGGYCVGGEMQVGVTFE